ncbi:hypothetical protein V6Z11_A05G443400 [Gossypium hirsutum]
MITAFLSSLVAFCLADQGRHHPTAAPPLNTTADDTRGRALSCVSRRPRRRSLLSPKVAKVKVFPSLFGPIPTTKENPPATKRRAIPVSEE